MATNKQGNQQKRKLLQQKNNLDEEHDSKYF